MSDEKDAFQRWLPLGLAVAGVALTAAVGYEAYVWIGMILT